MCSNKSEFEWNNEKTRFVKREYPGKLIDSEIRKLKFTIKETNRKSKSKNGVPYVVIYHPLLNSIYGIIRKNLYLNMNQRLKKCSVHRPWCLFVASRNWVAIWFEQNSILCEEGWVHTNVVAIVAKFAAVEYKVTCLNVITTKGLTKSTTALTGMRSVWFICYLVIVARNSI